MSDLVTLMALLRGLHLAATLSLLGTVGFIAWILPAATSVAPSLRRRLNRLCRASGVAAILAGIGWLILETAAMASVATPSEVVQALPLVALQTHYGKVMLARLGLLLIATVFFRPDSTSRISIILLLTAALSLQGFIGHAGAMGGERGAALTAFESLHLLAAGLWLGALMPLWLSLGRLPAASAQVVCMRFSPIGLGCVLVIAGTGLAQGLVLIGSLSALVDTSMAGLRW